MSTCSGTQGQTVNAALPTPVAREQGVHAFTLSLVGS